MLDFLIQLDNRWFLFLNSIHNPFFDWIMHVLSATGTWIPLYLILIFFIFKKLKWYGFIALFFLILLVILTDQGSNLFKISVQRLRPCHNPEIAQFVHLVNNECGGSFGFFSSHAANTFGMALFTSLLFKQRLFSGTIFFWASSVSYSRIYLGVHFVFDVLAGVFFGLLLGYLTFKIFEFTLSRIREKKRPVSTG